MQTRLSPEFADTREGREAEAILRQCVHCGFCTATCPTYQLLGDELDGPRGRIYLIKQVLEGEAPTRATQLHLDRCLTCRNCESTCPSGVRYGELVEIGRHIVDERVPRPLGERIARTALKEGLTSPLFAPAVALGRLARPLLPPALKQKVPRPAAAPPATPGRSHPTRMLLLAGCVQPSLMPNINAATVRVLDAAGIETIVAPGAGCCGAIRTHLGDVEGGLDHMRRNVDAWWPFVLGTDGGPAVEGIVFNASGCGVTVKEYGRSLAHDPAYAEKAMRIAGLARDLSELMPGFLALPELRRAASPENRVAFHAPCTLQHGQQLRGGVEAGLRALGFDVSVPSESHLCCGSAGTYSLLQHDLARRLRDRKLEQIGELQATEIVSANIGCIQHLQSGTETPVRHWIELLDERLEKAPPPVG